MARVGSLSPAAALEELEESPQSPSAYDRTSKRRLTVCVVGSGGVGKSSLTVRYLHNHFPEVSLRSSYICVLAAGVGAWHVILFLSFFLQFYDPTVGEFDT